MSSTFIQFVKFSIVGVSNTLIYLMVYYAFVYWRTEFYLVGNLVGWVVSVFNAWYWSRQYVFLGGRTSGGKQLLKSYATYGGTAILGTLLLWIGVEHGGISEWLGPWLTLIVTVPLNFIINKYWTFR